MRYWDTSGILALLLVEDASEEVASLFAADPDIFTWWATRVEAISAIERRARTGESAQDECQLARDRLAEIAARWQEIDPTNEVRVVAEDLLRRHALRAADSLQLAAALATLPHLRASLPFVTLDSRLRRAAGTEGFSVLPREPHRS